PGLLTPISSPVGMTRPRHGRKGRRGSSPRNMSLQYAYWRPAAPLLVGSRTPRGQRRACASSIPRFAFATSGIGLLFGGRRILQGMQRRYAKLVWRSEDLPYTFELS